MAKITFMNHDISEVSLFHVTIDYNTPLPPESFLASFTVFKHTKLKKLALFPSTYFAWNNKKSCNEAKALS